MLHCLLQKAYRYKRITEAYQTPQRTNVHETIAKEYYPKALPSHTLTYSMKTIKESGSKAMQEEYKAAKKDNEGNGMRIANNVRELVEGDKKTVCADN